MPTLFLENRSESVLVFNGTIPDVPPRRSVTIHLTVAKLEALEAGLLRMEAAGLCEFTTHTTSERADDRTEFVPKAEHTFGFFDPARVATTAPIVLSGLQVIDGVSAAVGDRVLVKEQASGLENGIYVVSLGAWERSLDMGDGFPAKGGTIITVAEGTLGEDTAWILSTNDPITVGVTPQDWIFFAGGAGTGTVFLWGDNRVASSTTTRFLTPGYDDGLAEVVATQITLPRSGILRGLRVRHNIPSGNGALVAYTLRVNGFVTGLSVVLASTAVTGSDLTTMIPALSGDLVDVMVTKAASIASSPVNVVATLELL